MVFENVIVLGNGFDLSLGYKTGYNHFYESLHFSNASRVASEKLNQRETIFDVINLDHSDKNNWLDLERLFKERYSGISSLSLSHLPISQIKEEYYLINQTMKVFLKDELKKDHFNPSKTIEHPIYSHLESARDESVLIVNFNYTQIPQKIFMGITKPANINLDFLDVHGSLASDNIILGVDDQFELYSPDVSFLRKSYHYETYKGYQISNILKAAKEVVFFGHSLGETDHVYFKELFISNAYSHTQNITIYDYNEDDFSNHYYQIDKMSLSRMSTLNLKRVRLTK